MVIFYPTLCRISIVINFCSLVHLFYISFTLVLPYFIVDSTLIRIKPVDILYHYRDGLYTPLILLNYGMW